jgi:hypothetical protein
MLSVFHYYSAKMRLRESKKTIQLMGGENECQPMLLAQRDMIEFEMNYYYEQINDLLWDLSLFTIFIIIIFALILLN